MGKHGLGRTGRYGFVGISVSQDQFIGDGINEAGLNAGLFYFRGSCIARPDLAQVGDPGAVELGRE